MWHVNGCMNESRGHGHDRSTRHIHRCEVSLHLSFHLVPGIMDCMDASSCSDAVRAPLLVESGIYGESTEKGLLTKVRYWIVSFSMGR